MSNKTKIWLFERTNKINKPLSVYLVGKEEETGVARNGPKTPGHLSGSSCLCRMPPTHTHSVTILGWLLLLRCWGCSAWTLARWVPCTELHPSSGPDFWHVFLTCLLASLHLFPFVRKLADMILLHGTASSLLLGSIAVTCRGHAVPLQAGLLVAINDFCNFISSSFQVTVEKQDNN